MDLIHEAVKINGDGVRTDIKDLEGGVGSWSAKDHPESTRIFSHRN